MDHQFLSGTELFGGLNENEINSVLSCLKAREAGFKKNDIIFHAGDCIEEIGLITRGSVNITVNFYNGSSSIFDHITAGNIFGEAYASVPGKKLLCDVVAADDCGVMFLNIDKLISVCENVCPFHQQLINNFLRISAQKSLRLSSKVIHTASKSTRERLISYFSEQSLKSGSVYFTIPFSRQQLADYLGVERSALSNTLSKMQKDGLIQYHKNEFKLLRQHRTPELCGIALKGSPK